MSFADFRKGFDLVDHNIIIQELENLHVNPIIVLWIKSFLTNRKQCVRIGESYSSWKTVNGGLPQGTKLGPILFAVLINPLLKDWSGRIKYVDDTTVMEIIPRCSPSLLPIVVDEITEFSSARGMELNHKKCKEMLILFLEYSTSTINPIYVSGIPVEVVPSFKLLGLTLSCNLSWSSHVDFIMRKANSRLYALRQLKRAGVGQHDLVSIYCSIIRSRVEYAAPAWSNLTTGLSNLIETVQRRALKIVFPSLSYGSALSCSGLETLEARRTILSKRFVDSLKIPQDICQNPLSQIVCNQSMEWEHDYNLRKEQIYIPLIRTERFKNYLTIKYL